MSKKKNNEERKPDLNEAENQAEIEARIKEMMELDEPKSAAKTISVVDHDEENAVSAPELPEAKKAFSIKVVDHNEPSEPEAPEPEVSPEENEELAAAIEEANKQLMNEKSDDTEKEDEEEDEPEEPESTGDSGEEPQTAPELSELSEEEPRVTEDAQEGADDTIDESQAQAEEEQETPPKEKPLKHLDSIVPKTKVSETIESPTTDKAVEEIVASEADELLKAEDEKLAEAFQPEPKVGFGKKLLSIFKKKGTRRTLIIAVLAGLSVIIAVPSSRYHALNAVGVRSSASLTVLDESTRQPLKGVTVKLGESEESTDQEGKVIFNEVRLGSTELLVEKRAFASVSKELVIGWGSNPLTDISLTPTGSQYTFIVTDYLSGKPVVKAEAASNESSAISNEQGEIKLTIDQQDDSPRDVTITAEGYRIEKFPLNLEQKEPQAIKLVPTRKHVFISNRSGRFDVYKVDVDGQNEKLVLPGTGSEREDMVLAAHPTDEIVALVSTKDNRRNSDGFLLSTLTIIDLNEETSKGVVSSERVQIIDWVGSRIVYVQIKEGASGDSPDRHKLMSYDYKSGETKELAASNYFNDVLIADGQVYVAPSSTNSSGMSASLLRFDADGSNKQTIINKEVWNIFRTSYDKLLFAVGQDWYELKLGESQPGKISGEPPSQVSKIYTDSPDKKRSLWVDIRDGKGVLLVYNIESKQDDIIRTQGGLKQPVRWLNDDVIVYRINTEAETADYALNLDGGEPVKIRDVANTSGINTWYYY